MSASVVGVAFVAMIGMMLLGIPIAVAMAAVGIIGGIAAYGAPFMDSIAPVVWGVQNENLLTSIPLFVLLGELLLRSGIADRMYIALSAWLGRLPGGLLHTNIGSCALFAATSGSSVATAATVGTVALPSLRKRGYSMRASLGRSRPKVTSPWPMPWGRASAASEPSESAARSAWRVTVRSSSQRCTRRSRQCSKAVMGRE